METFFSFGSRAIALVLLVQLGFLSPLAPVFAQEAAEPVVAPLETTVETPVVTEPTEPTEAALVTPPAPTTEESEKTPVTITEPATLTVPAEEVATSPEVSSSAPAAVEGEKIGGEEASALAPERQDENKQEIITSEKPKPLTYTAMTRELRAARAGKKEKNQEMMTQLERFIEAEKERLEKLPVGEDKRDAYLDLLESQARMLRGEKEKQSEGVVEKLKNVFADEEKKPGMTDGKTVQLLDKPAKFGFSSDEVTVQHFGSEMFKKKEKDTAFNFLSNPFAAVPALAHGSVLPTLEDTRADNGEVTITPEIRDIAEALGNNPTNILNFVRNTVSYEPYYGAKKGSVGCLQELVCNDVDTSSLLVALLRAAGVPARYKKSVAVLSAEQVRQLVGVQETRTAFGAFAWNKIPIYTLQSANAGKKLDEADFSIENQLAMEWVFVEAFYDYDERAGNHNNMLSFEGVTSTAAMQAELGQYPNKQWVLLDAVVKPYTHTSKEVVGDTAQFNTESFWYDYLRYQGPNSPLEKYRQDLIARTGKDIATVNFQSTKAAVRSALPYLPPKLPYYTGTGDVGGSLIVPEAWSVLPANRRQQVTVSLIKESDRGVVISHTFFGSEINNVEMSLFYDGATESDSQIIESYGGIAYTPAALVSIVPVLEMAGATYGPGSALTIGDQLIMQFDYGSNGQVIYSDQKFSTAGNQEGVYVSLSKVTDEPDADTKEKIVLQGNAAIARAYLKHVEDAGRTLKQALDYEYNVGFARSVVTQNRVLGKVDGVPT
ncbi:MAG TPA: transglutaminase domain-containing protein, partial [Patescibacteria group bacterium]|nr:transglutaminase domain-containing protein [Patescibacteria group bacterium]